MEAPKPADVDLYIAGSVSEARPILNELREIIKATVPDAEERISYGVPFYKYHGEFVGFATNKAHVSFGFGADVLQSEDRKMLEQQGYKLGIGTMQIGFSQRVPIAEIKEILEAKARMNEAKAAAKQTRDRD